MLSVAHWILFSNPPLTAKKEVARLPFLCYRGLISVERTGNRHKKNINFGRFLTNRTET